MRIAFWGNFGIHNFGNECTLAAILYNMRRRLPDGEFESISVVPDDTAARHHVKAIPMWSLEPARGTGLVKAIRRAIKPLADWTRTLRHTRGLSALIIPGTGVLNDIDEGSFGFPYNLFKWVLATRLNGGKVFFVSVGVERIGRPLPRFFIRCALGLAGRRSFRDHRSVDLIRAIGFRGAGDVFPDLAFSLPPYLPATAPHRSGGKTVAVGLYNYRDPARHGSTAGSYRGYIERISLLIPWLIARGYAVRLVIGDISGDMGVRADVRAQLEERGFDLTHAAFTDEPATSYEQVMDQLAAVDFVIASRFHNIILALFLGRLVISLSYEGKIEALMQDIGLGGYCQALNAFDLERLQMQFLQLEREAPVLRGTVAESVRANRDRLGRQYDLIMADLGGHPDRELTAGGA